MSVQQDTSRGRRSLALVVAAGLALAAATLLEPSLILLGPALILLGALGWVAFVHPTVAIAGLAAIIVTNLADVATNIHGLPPIGQLTVPALALVLVLRAATGREDLRPAAIVAMPALAYLCITALPLLWVDARGPTVEHLSALLRNLLILLVFVGFLTSLYRLRIVLQTVAVCIAVLAALGVLQYATGNFGNNLLGMAQASVRQIAGELNYWRLSGPLPDPNFFAQLLVLGLPLVAAQVYVARSLPLKIMGVVGPPLIVAAIVFTYSRGGLFALLVMAVFAIGMTRHRAIIGALAAVIAALVLASGAVSGRMAPVWQALSALIEGGPVVSDPAIAQRLAAQAAAVDMFLQHPIAGVGAGQFPHLYGSYARVSGLDLGAQPYPHNLFLEVAAEGGLIGIAMFMAVALTPLLLARRAVGRMEAAGRQREAVLTRALIVGFIGYLATSVFLHGAYPRFFWFEIALLLSAWIAARATVDIPHPASEPLQRRTAMQQTETSLLADAARGVRRYSFAIILLTLLFGGLAAWQAYSTPQLHSAEAKLFYRFGREYFPISPGEQRREWGENVQVSLNDALYTEMHLMSTWELMRETAATLNPEELRPGLVAETERAAGLLAARAQTQPPAPTAAGQSDELLRNMTKELQSLIHYWRIEGTTLLVMSVRHSDPAYADMLLSRHLQSYLEHRQALFNPDHERFFREQLEQAQQEYAAVIGEIEALRENWGIRDPEADRRVLSDRFAHLGELAKAWPEDPQMLADAADARAALARLNRFEEAFAPLDARRAALAQHLGRLEEERQAAELQRDFWGGVASSVEVIDRREAEANPVGMGPVPRVAGASLLGLLTGSALAAGAGLAFARRPERNNVNLARSDAHELRRQRGLDA